ncbi:MAG: hypothetical protein P0Y65_18440 [Candidatus Devosia phytovorans]|uniref:Uncharacterized protein n=1 Tax=Candidatus Devosia phytovorans TaxID=3121372 RepID=A0AAJ5VTN4_9HYPH|nr:hypothetical protein [Devosia sp.]WEK04137.1 MAG: hypothetical protein P0Y65_18440 [Devosia sp.]
MRGIINFIQGVSFEVREFGWTDTLANLLAGIRSATRDHAGLYLHPDGWTTGSVIYLRVPFTRLSAMLEWSDISLGWGLARSQDGLDIYAARAKASLCSEQGELFRSARGSV